MKPSTRSEWIQRFVPGSKVDPVKVASAASAAASFPKAITQMYQQKQQNATNRGIEFSLPLDEFSVLNKRSHCAYTGLPFMRNEQEYKRTFERIDPTIGYIPGNVVVCSSAANHAKSGLDCFEQSEVIPDEMKIHLLERTLKRIRQKIKDRSYEPEYTVVSRGPYLLPIIRLKD